MRCFGSLVLSAVAGCFGSPGGDAAESCPEDAVLGAAFEAGTSGWSAAMGTLDRVSPGRDGSEHAAQLCSDDPPAAYVSVTTDPPPVSAPEAGARYRLDVWVRSEGEGATLEANLRELNPGGAEQSTVEVALDETWQLVTVERTVAQGDSTALEAYLAVPDPLAGDCVSIDDVCLVEL